MDAPVARIVSVTPGRATVAVDAGKVCARCAEGKGCGAGFLAVQPKSRLIEVRVTPGLDLRPGDEVRLTLAPAHLLRAAVLAYGLPLFGVLAALALAWAANLRLTDGQAVAVASVGLVAGFGLGRRRLRRDACLKDFVPSVLERNGQNKSL